MILELKHVGVILNVLMQKFYVCALIGVLIKWLYEVHGATIKKAYENREVLILRPDSWRERLRSISKLRGREVLTIGIGYVKFQWR